MAVSLCVFLLLFTLCSVNLGHELVLSTPTDLVKFSSDVNSGTSYAGTTVLLGGDMDFADDLSDQYAPCGYYESVNNYRCFLGTFDGQGHVISNLAVNSAAVYVGLFGYTTGATIRNVVMDASCSVMNYYTGSGFSRVAGILGECRGGPCVLEGNINMAGTYYVGDTTGDAYHGGIVARLYPSAAAMTVRNCVNYGPATLSGTWKLVSYFGGIAGLCFGTLANQISIQNCMNYGSFTYVGSSSKINVGGIAGYGSYITIANCVSAGKLTPNNGVTGTIIGYTENYVRLVTVVSTPDVGEFPVTGLTNGDVECTEDFPSISGASVNTLNYYATKSGWNRWLVVGNKASVTFRTNGGSGFALTSLLVVLPEPAPSAQHAFSGWYADPLYTTKFIASSVSASKVLHGVWNYTVGFDGNGGFPALPSKVVTYGNAYGALPTAAKVGYSLVGWFTTPTGEKEVTADMASVVSSCQTLYARWTPRSYTVVFDGNGGTPSQPTKEVFYDTTYGVMPSATRPGYSLIGWFTEPEGGEEVNRDVVYKTPEGLTLYAHWEDGNYTVKFDYGNGTVTEETYKHNEDIRYPENVVREGFEFLGWDKNITGSYGDSVVIKALWKEISASSHKDSNGKSNGDKTKNGGSGTPSAAIIAISVVVPLFFVIIVALVVVVLVLFRAVGSVTKDDIPLEKMPPAHAKADPKKEESTEKSSSNSFTNSNSSSGATEDSENASRVCVTATTDTPNDVLSGEMAAEKSFDTCYKVYSPGYTRPPMKEALIEAGLTEKQADNVSRACINAASFARDDGKLFGDFTEEDAAAVAMYTYDFGPEELESNPYRIINKGLVGKNFSDMQKSSGILYLVMSALRKLPRVSGVPLYRSVRSDASLDKDRYREGNVVTWPGLTSASPNMNFAKAFLGKASNGKKATSTLFVVENGWGYNIQPYSLFPGETEILLEPERQFKVISVTQADGINIVKLQMMKTPLVLPKVFGRPKHKKSSKRGADKKDD